MSSDALKEALKPLTPEDRVDIIGAAREGMRRLGDLKESQNQVSKPTSTLRQKLTELRESLEK